MRWAINNDTSDGDGCRLNSYHVGQKGSVFTEADRAGGWLCMEYKRSR